MPQTEVYFEEQWAVIIKHLTKAKSFILVAMAWFTDESLFDLLLQRAQEGVQVLLLIHDDEINSTSGITYEKMNGKNSELYLIADEKKTMHHKFCVIDGVTVLHGSYNWTNQARYNHENLLVTEGDIFLAASFIMQFNKIKKIHSLKKESVESVNIKPTENENAPQISTHRSRRRDNTERVRNILEIMRERQERANQAALKQRDSNSVKPDGTTNPTA
jgi:phosphatidylserine/phosphatidylglycerophosphate/cardiolipin synthase-like enzyme